MGVVSLDEVRAELVAMREAVERMLERSTERPKLYTREESARLLSVSPKTISRMVAHGELLAVKLRGKLLVPAEEVDRVSRPEQPSLKAEPKARFDAAAALARLEELRPSKRKRG